MIKNRLLCLSTVMISWTSATVAHYSDFWVGGYFVSVLACLLMAAFLENTK